MKNIALNTLDYTGVVTLSQLVGSKQVKIAQVHNRGDVPLFTFLANCLIGNFKNAVDNCPKKIKLLNKEILDTAEVYSSVSGFIFLRRQPEIVTNDSGECRVRYSFMIPRDLLENITSVSTLCLGLYAKHVSERDPEEFSAVCALGPELDLDRNTLTTTSLLVDWELVITNNSPNTSRQQSKLTGAAETQS